jgi:hypothetical protein
MRRWSLSAPRYGGRQASLSVAVYLRFSVKRSCVSRPVLTYPQGAEGVESDAAIFVRCLLRYLDVSKSPSVETLAIHVPGRPVLVDDRGDDQEEGDEPRRVVIVTMIGPWAGPGTRDPIERQDPEGHTKQGEEASPVSPHKRRKIRPTPREPAAALPLRNSFMTPVYLESQMRPARRDMIAAEAARLR